LRRKSCAAMAISVRPRPLPSRSSEVELLSNSPGEGMGWV
jgi:hypothetical protein